MADALAAAGVPPAFWAPIPAELEAEVQVFMDAANALILEFTPCPPTVH